MINTHFDNLLRFQGSGVQNAFHTDYYVFFLHLCIPDELACRSEVNILRVEINASEINTGIVWMRCIGGSYIEDAGRSGFNETATNATAIDSNYAIAKQTKVYIS